MKLTVGIIFHNEESNLPGLLESLKYFPEHDLILVDNCSTDQSRTLAEAFLKNSGKNFRFISRDFNSLAGARNDILQAAQTELLYFVDADCEIQPETWKELSLGIDISNEKLCAIGGGQDFPHDVEVLQSLDLIRTSYWGHFGSPQMKKGFNLEYVSHLSTTHIVYVVQHVKSVGGFHKKLHRSAEDLELSLRLQAAGFQMVFVPRSRVIHRMVGSWWEWWKKALRNGLWQTRLMAYNLDILKTLRPWPGILGPLFLWFFPFQMIFIFILYLLLLMGISIWQKKPKLMAAYLVTHSAYAVGEVLGLFAAVFDFMVPMKTKT